MKVKTNVKAGQNDNSGVVIGQVVGTNNDTAVGIGQLSVIL
jgi:hypothetical protein